MNGKIIGIFIMGSALIGGIAMYFLQVYAFYDELPEGGYEVQLTSVATGQTEAILATDVRAIDADSSPLRFRACFTTTNSTAMLTESFVIYDKPVPLTAPGWFDCYNADAVGDALEADQAIAYLAQKDVHDGVDRVIAIFDDGRGYAWHQLNDKFSE